MATLTVNLRSFRADAYRQTANFQVAGSWGGRNYSFFGQIHSGEFLDRQSMEESVATLLRDIAESLRPLDELPVASVGQLVSQLPAR